MWKMWNIAVILSNGSTSSTQISGPNMSIIKPREALDEIVSRQRRMREHGRVVAAVITDTDDISTFYQYDVDANTGKIVARGIGKVKGGRR